MAMAGFEMAIVDVGADSMADSAAARSCCLKLQLGGWRCAACVACMGAGVLMHAWACFRRILEFRDSIDNHSCTFVRYLIVVNLVYMVCPGGASSAFWHARTRW